MARETYQQSLNDLRDDVIAMGDLVIERLKMALSSLDTGDETLVREVITGDAEVNQMYLTLESQCIGLFAREQPVAGDLRFITASFKIITDLERIGDLATNLAEYALATDQDRTPKVAIGQISENAMDLVKRSLDAYASDNADVCEEIAASDDEIDALCQQASETVTRDLIGRESNGDGPWAVEQLLDDVSRVLLTVRDLERIGDHGVNIAARTLYMVENDPSLIY